MDILKLVLKSYSGAGQPGPKNLLKSKAAFILMLPDTVSLSTVALQDGLGQGIGGLPVQQRSFCP